MYVHAYIEMMGIMEEELARKKLDRFSFCWRMENGKNLRFVRRPPNQFSHLLFTHTHPG